MEDKYTPKLYFNKTKGYEIKFYPDKSVPEAIIQDLNQLHFPILSNNSSTLQTYDEHYYLHESKRRNAILLTTNERYLDWAVISMEDMNRACVVVLKTDDHEGDVNLYGSILYNLIKQIEFIRKNRLRKLKIEIGKALKLYYPAHGLKWKEEFDISSGANGKYVFKKTMDDCYDNTILLKILNYAVPKFSRRNNYLECRFVSFQRLDKLIPEDKGELLGEIISKLYDKDIMVFTENSQILKGLKRKIKDYKNANVMVEDAEIKKILNEVLTEHEPSKENGFYRQESISISASDIGAEQELMIEELTITLPTIPLLSTVKPEEAVGGSLLLETKPQKNIDRKKSDSSDEDEESDNDYSDESNQSEITIPKVFDTATIARNRMISSIAQITGRRAEEIVMKYLNGKLLQHERRHIRWVAVLGEKPGWDIEYVDSNGKLVAIEVKGTIRKSFLNIKISANEWEAAIQLKDKYWLYLVTDSHSNNPQIQRIQNPFGLKETGKLQVTPMSWLIELIR